MEFLDSHCHLDDEKFDIDREKVIPEIYNAGITTFVNCGYSLQGSLRAIELSKKYDYIYATVGISPNDLSTNWSKDVENIDEILKKEGTIQDNKIFQKEGAIQVEKVLQKGITKQNKNM